MGVLRRANSTVRDFCYHWTGASPRPDTDRNKPNTYII